MYQLTGYTYNFIKDPSIRKSGVIAQDVLSVLPEAVDCNPDSLSVDYPSLVPLLIEAIKELKFEIEELKERLNGN